MKIAVIAAVWCGSAMLALATNAAERLVDVDALVHYETRQLTASGVTRVDTWQERLVRRGNQVWTERVLPPSARVAHERETPDEHAGHAHFNGETSARWLTLAADGSVDVRFVDHEHKAVVSVPRAEFGTVGFDGRFDAAASIVPPSVAGAMKVSGTSGAEQWRSGRSDGWSHRVLWSPLRQIAMRVESQRDDGSVRRVVTVTLRPAARSLPWSQLADYTPKHYGDFMD